MPPLRYDVVHRLEARVPGHHRQQRRHQTLAQVAEQLDRVDGVMLGRAAYHDPWWLAEWDAAFFGAAPSALTREQVEEQMVAYMERQGAEHGTSWYAIARHMLGVRAPRPAGCTQMAPGLERPPAQGLPARAVWALANAKVQAAASRPFLKCSRMRCPPRRHRARSGRP